MTSTETSQELHWFVAYVQSCQERNVAARLSNLGYQCYLPIRRELRQWSDRKKLVERLLLPRLVFIRCTELDRRRSFDLVPYLYKYITASDSSAAAIIRDSEMDLFRSMVDQTERPVEMRAEPLFPGDHVKVVTGPLAGIECELVSVEGRRCLAVRLGVLGTAVMDLSLDSVKKLEEK